MSNGQRTTDNGQRAALRVAFQGERGAYSEEAIAKLLGDGVEAVPCPTFESLFRAVDEGRAERVQIGRAHV